MNQHAIMTNPDCSQPTSMTGELVAFSERLMDADSCDEVFDALADFTSAQNMGTLLLQVRAPHGRSGSERWTRLDAAHQREHDRSDVQRMLQDLVPINGRPASVAWSIVPNAGFRRVGDAVARAFLQNANIAGGVFAGMALPGGRSVTANVLVPNGTLSQLTNGARDLFLVAAIHSFMALDRLLGPLLPTNLTRRELEALRLSARGMGTREIAGAMRIAEATVKFHLMGARKKLNVKTTREGIAKIAGLTSYF